MCTHHPLLGAAISSACRRFLVAPRGVHLGDDTRVRRTADAPVGAVPYARSGDLGGASARAAAVARRRSWSTASWPWCCSSIGVVTVFTAGPHRRHDASPSALALADDPGRHRARSRSGGRARSCAARHRRAPASSCSIAADWPEGATPMAVLLLTYTVAAWDTPRRARARPRRRLRHARRPRLHRHARARHPRRRRQHRHLHAWPGRSASPCAPGRDALESRVREAEERANVERQTRGAGAGRGAAAHRPGAARRRRPLDVGDRRAGRRRRPRARRAPRAGPSRARGHLGDVPRHAHRDAPAARRAPRRATASARTHRRPASPTCRSSSTTCAAPGVPVELDRRRATPTAWPPAWSCRPTGSCRRRSPT